MKKQFVLMALAAVISISSVSAQGGQGGQRQTPEERTKATIEKLAPLNLDDATKGKTTVIFTDYYTASQKAMEDMRASGTFDRDAMMAKRKELSDARDAKLKLIFTEEQMKKWKDEIEPSLRPQRQGGQGNG
jgi:periplasmic protein CpxP/Spy